MCWPKRTFTVLQNLYNVAPPRSCMCIWFAHVYFLALFIQYVLGDGTHVTIKFDPIEGQGDDSSDKVSIHAQNLEGVALSGDFGTFLKGNTVLFSTRIQLWFSKASHASLTLKAFNAVVFKSLHRDRAESPDPSAKRKSFEGVPLSPKRLKQMNDLKGLGGLDPVVASISEVVAQVPEDQQVLEVSDNESDGSVETNPF